MKFARRLGGECQITLDISSNVKFSVYFQSITFRHKWLEVTLTGTVFMVQHDHKW